MISQDDINESIIGKRRTGKFDDPFKSFQITLPILNGKAILPEIPNRFEKVNVTGYTSPLFEIEDGDIDTNLYRVDYTEGVVFFNVIHNNTNLNFSFLGEGRHFFPSEGIWVTNDDNGIQTAKEKFDRIDLDVLAQKERVDQQIVSVPQPSEIVDIRVDRNGNVYPVAKDRIDAEQKKIEDAYEGKDGTNYTSIKDRFDHIDDEIGDISFLKNKDNLVESINYNSDNIGDISLFKQNGNSISEKVTNEFNDYGLNVKWYGAVGDGVHDDTLSLQNTINKAVEEDKRLKLPKGIYGVSTTIVFPDGLRIDSDNATIIALNNFNGAEKSVAFEGSLYSNYPVVYANLTKKIEIKGLLTVDGNKANNPKSNVSCLFFDNCSNLYLERVKAINNKATDSASLVGGAFFINGGSRGTFIDCEVDGVDVEGLLFRNFTNAKVRGGEYQNSTSSVIGTQNGGFIKIDGVNAHDTANSVISLNSPDSKVVNSDVYNSTAYGGIVLGHRTTFETKKPADRGIVSNNHVYNCYAGGVIVQYGRDITIKGNQIYDCNGAYTANDITQQYGGINATGWCDSLTIVDNNVKNCNRGIYVAAGKVDATNSEYTYGKHIIENNTVKNNKLSGIQLNDIRFATHVLNNIVQDNNTEKSSVRGEILVNYDFTLGLSIVGGVYIKGNTIGNILANSGYIGIRLSYGGTLGTLNYPVVIEDNHIMNMSSSLISNSLGLDNTDIRNNYFDGSMEQSQRTDISTTTTTINIGHARFIRLTGTGTFNVDTISHKHGVGTIITIQALNTPTLIDGSNLLLNSDFVMTTNDTITLIWTGGAWMEICRSAN
jgi:parallel beta-helix repeat protein